MLRVGVTSDSVSEKGDVGKTFVRRSLQSSGSCVLKLAKPFSIHQTLHESKPTMVRQHPPQRSVSSPVRLC